MFPLSTLFHYPVLLILADGKVHTRKEMVSFEIKMLALSESDQNTLTSRGVKKVESWTSYAIADLKKSLYIEHKNNGYVITKDGMDFFNKHKDGFIAKDLKASKAYREYKRIGEFSKKNIKGNSKAITKKGKSNDLNENERAKNTLEGVVYILTNPAFKTFYIKIGYTTNIKERLKELYNTSVPMPFIVFALLKTTKYKQAEKMIHSAFKASRIGDDREFFMLKPEEAFEQMKIIGEGLDAVVILYDEKGNIKKTYDFSK